MNILDAAQKKGLTMKRIGRTAKRGEEWAGPCPVCGGDDRLRICPDQGTKGGSFFCRQCGIKGDCIQFLREHLGYSFKDAATEVGMQLKGGQGRTPAPILKPQRSNEESTGGIYHYPPEAWSEKAFEFISGLRTSNENITRAVNYLATRGINAETAGRYGMVWNPQNYFRSLSGWGLKEEDKGNGQPVRFFIPAGLVIPIRSSAGIIRLRVRRESGDPRYLAVKGSSVEPLAIRTHERCLVVVEAELDAMLIRQAAGDLVSVMATGSTTVRPSSLQVSAVHRFPLILLAFDNDAPGEHACQWWLKEFPQAKRFKPAGGKDPGEAPHLVRQWIAERVPWGASADFLKKKKEGIGAVKKPEQQVPWKCRGCWAQQGEDMCCRSGEPVAIIDAVKNCEYQ